MNHFLREKQRARRQDPALSPKAVLMIAASIVLTIALITVGIYCADVASDKLIGNRGKYLDTTSTTEE